MEDAEPGTFARKILKSGKQAASTFAKLYAKEYQPYNFETSVMVELRSLDEEVEPEMVRLFLGSVFFDKRRLIDYAEGFREGHSKLRF